MSALIIYLENLSKDNITKISENSDNLNSKEWSVLLYLWSLVFLDRDNVWLSTLTAALNFSEQEAFDLLVSMQEKGIKIHIKYIHF